MGKEQWGWWFRIKRQLDNSELARYEKYVAHCRKYWDGRGIADQEIWRGVLSKLMDV